MPTVDSRFFLLHFLSEPPGTHKSFTPPTPIAHPTWILQYRHLPSNSFIAIKSNKSSSEPSSSSSDGLIDCPSSVVVAGRRWSLLVVAPIQRRVLESGEIAAPKIWGPLQLYLAPKPLFVPLLPNPLPSPNPPAHSKISNSSSIPRSRLLAALTTTGHLSPIIQFIHHHHRRGLAMEFSHHRISCFGSSYQNTGCPVGELLTLALAAARI